MKKTIGIACAVLGSIATIVSVIVVILNKRNNNCRKNVQLPKEIEDFTIKHFEFGG